MEYKVINSEDAPAEVFAMPGTVGMAAIDDSGEVVGYFGFVKTVTLDPIWIRPDKRKSPFLLRRLWERSKKFLRECGAVSVGGTTMRHSQENRELVERIAKSIGNAKIMQVDFLHMDLME